MRLLFEEARHAAAIERFLEKQGQTTFFPAAATVEQERRVGHALGRALLR
jgi:hypothetical protein